MNRHRRFRALFVLFLLASLVTATMADDLMQMSDEEFRDAVLEWREGRLQRLTSPTGYLALAGILWLENGEYTVGSGEDDDLVLRQDVAPAHAATIHYHDGIATVKASPGVELRIGDEIIESKALTSDIDGDPDLVQLGEVTFYLIQRADHFGIRLRDPKSPIRTNFHGIDSWPIQKEYAVEARFEPYDPPHKLPIVNEIGFIDSMWTTGSLHFTVNGEECSMDALVYTLEDDFLFLIFRDATSGEETYGAGRFLYTDAPKNGRVVIDFNRAYNPPCAFSPYTTCPIPPLQNELDVAIRAGEKRYDSGSTRAHH
jgi:uncharacterized protein (DUF1684 family)